MAFEKASVQSVMPSPMAPKFVTDTVRLGMAGTAGWGKLMGRFRYKGLWSLAWRSVQMDIHSNISIVLFMFFNWFVSENKSNDLQ